MFAIVLHTMVGTLAGTDSEFQNPESQVSAHFGVGLDGTVHQYVDWQTAAAWANGGPNPGWRWPFGAENPNLRTVSIETEDLGNPDGQLVTDAQYTAVKQLCEMVQQHWPVTHLVAHVVINPQHSCPAARWLQSGKFGYLAGELGLQALQ